MALGAPTRSATTPTATARASKFVPLSTFFLQLDGGGEGAESDKKQVTGYIDKGTAEKSKKKDPFAGVSFDDDENNQTTAMQGPRPPPGKRKKKPKAGGGGGQPPEFAEAVEGGTTRFTGTASKAQPCRFCKSAATKSLIWADGRAYIPVCNEHEQKARNIIIDENDDEIAYVRKVDEGMTTTANVAAYPVPLGVPMQRRAKPVSEKQRKKWMDRLAKMVP